MSRPADLRTTSDPAVISGWGAFCQLYVIALAGVSVVVASHFRTYLPQRFTLDAEYIAATLAVPDGALNPDDAFRNIALVYRVLGLTEAQDVAAMLALAVFTVAVVAGVRWGELARLTPPGLVTITLCYVLALIYLAQYSKEFVSLILVAATLLLPRGWWAEVLLIAGFLGYAATIRPYWAVVVVIYVGARFLLPRVRGLLPVAGLAFLTYLGLQGAFNIVLGEALSWPRVSVNQTRADINADVGSLIVDFLPDSVGLQALNAFLILLSLLLPWPLLLGGSATYLAMAVLLMALWGLVAWSIRRWQVEHHLGRAPGPAKPSDRHRRQPRALPGAARYEPLLTRSPRPERAIALLVAMVVVQAVFEPDYGSYVKHLTPMLPLFLTLLPLTRPAAPGRSPEEPA